MEREEARIPLTLIFEWIKVTWPIVLVAGTMLIWFLNRLESVEQKQRRIDISVFPVIDEVNDLREDLGDLKSIQSRNTIKLDVHREAAGHSVILEKTNSIEKEVFELRRRVGDHVFKKND
tara:strand:- start:1482 stop:1841 length:360 start_codon:yes stop_codon:yes gene_type:complete